MVVGRFDVGDDLAVLGDLDLSAVLLSRHRQPLCPRRT
jgi:hypothetical protein